jgi:hypothetical protein
VNAAHSMASHGKRRIKRHDKMQPQKSTKHK